MSTIETGEVYAGGRCRCVWPGLALKKVDVKRCFG